LYSLNDRIVDCFLRSENATGAVEDESPSTTSPEVLALSAYLTWLARGSEVGKNPPWRGQNVIEASNLIPVKNSIPAAAKRFLWSIARIVMERTAKVSR